LKENVPFGTTEQVTRELQSLVKDQIASYAVPEMLQVGRGTVLCICTPRHC